MMHTVAGLFENHRTADLVVEHLVQEYGIPRERVRVHAGDPAGAAEARSPQDSDQGASLSDLGLPEETVRAYAEGTSRGGVLVAAQVEGSRVERIVAAYREYGAADVNAREAEWSSTGSSEIPG
ncbi:MAG TPA: hypothetical protein VKA25_09515 [Gemmatimonadales bacterium]|jgi:hypothetical protein|nr:hypothetical protein [Gemmatimonadales bacterium]